MKQPVKSKPKCIECGRVTRRVHGILDVSLCADCNRGQPDKYGCITKTRAKREYRLTESDLMVLDCIVRPNPHYKCAAPMQLYLHKHIRQVSSRRYGYDEPYAVTLVQLNESQIKWFSEDTDRLYDVSADTFQRLIADRLETMGFGVRLIGDVYHKDGGVDIIAWPKQERLVFPFLLAVQVKHHRSPKKTGPSVVRDFHGVISSANAGFNVGLIVTNTAFTPDACWFAENRASLVRLRNIQDLHRWLRGDFANESEWREIPRKIQLAPGVEIEIPRPRYSFSVDPNG